jgi:hypothetical protein
MQQPISLALKVAIGLLMTVSAIELGFVTATVAWLQRTASKGFQFQHDGSSHQLAGIPLNFLVDQGHTSNGAAGTALVLIGFGGAIALYIRNSNNHQSRNWGQCIYYLWLALNIPALLLTTGALGYVFSVTNARYGQTIDPVLAANLDGNAYPLDSWTPQNWFAAVLGLDRVTARDDIESHLRIMHGWQYNLIPFFCLHLLETVLAFMEYRCWMDGVGGRKEQRHLLQDYKC